MKKNLLHVMSAGRELPEGCDCWGMKSVMPDMTTKFGFKYPEHGWVEAEGPILGHAHECPNARGDGLCVATTFCGMASGGISASKLLLVAFPSLASLGCNYSISKIRVRRMYVVEVVDGYALVREHGAGSDLRGASMYGAYLHGADLRGANLHGANLRWSDLSGANLHGADLSVANLYGADLSGANLDEADMTGAELGLSRLTDTNLESVFMLNALFESPEGTIYQVAGSGIGG